MDMKIPVIKIDLFENSPEDSTTYQTESNAVKDKRGEINDLDPQKNALKNSTEPTEVHGTSSEYRNGTFRKERSIQSQTENAKTRRTFAHLAKSGIHSVRIEGFEDKNGGHKPDAVSEKCNKNGENADRRSIASENTSKTPEITRKSTLPKLEVEPYRNNIDAIVSPLLLRRHRNNDKRMSVDILPRKGAKCLIDITPLSRVNSSKFPGSIKSSWMSAEDQQIIQSPPAKQGVYQDAIFRNSLRRATNSLDMTAQSRSRTDRSVSTDQKPNKGSRPRSRSMCTFDEEDTTEPDDSLATHRKPSKHWHIARDYMNARSIRLPELVNAYRKHELIQAKQATDTDKFTPNKGQSQSKEDALKTFLAKQRKMMVKSKSEEVVDTKDDEEEILYVRDVRAMSLEERLQAIERRHGIVHDEVFEQND
ncbi:uncharacterized protein LOC135682785 [Rhopilema esculentum]|uniref:uncharacterized protein LOC135682785 n=1 Tax=Rhopilema esculentum TaxID=499914 RepID=UPI0031E47747|eukprot:gene14103-5091_t